MEAFGFSQLIDTPMHNSGNILDLIFINSTSKMEASSTELGPFLSDHRLLTVEYNVKVPVIKRQHVEIRSKKDFKLDDFTARLDVSSIDTNNGLYSVCNQLSTELQNTLELCVPKKSCVVGDRQKNSGSVMIFYLNEKLSEEERKSGKDTMRTITGLHTKERVTG